MRFDYQPALIDVKIFKTYKQRKLFFALTTGIIGCLIVISSIGRSIINYNISPIELNKNLFLSFTNINSNSNSQKSNIENNNINPQIINTENTQIISPISNHINQSNPQTKIVDLQNNTGGVNLNYHVLELPKSLNITDLGKIQQDEIQQDEIKQQEENANWQIIKIKSGDTLIGILQGLSMPKVYLKDLNNFVKVNQNCTAVNNLKSGYSIKILLNAENDLQIIKLPLAPHKILHIDKIGPRNYRAYFEEKPIIKKLTFARSKILGSFYASAQSVG
ncbi:MAG: LysM-like peptidoglycan-binding domain-containing protein, partial [Gammaproteobacteria bacterium]